MRVFFSFALPVALASSLLACRRSPGTAPALATRFGKPVAFTSGAFVEVTPAFSPDGQSLAYASNETGAFELYVKRLRRGETPRALTRDGKQNLQPAFSPDGKRIAFHSKDRGGIWVLPIDGGDARPIADFGTRPSWSPDGEWIAFQSHAITDMGATSVPTFPPSTIWVVPSRGGPAREVTEPLHPPGGHGNPLFSPDGKEILFVATDPKLFRGEMWSIPAAGGEPKRLFSAPRLLDPALTRDGRAVFYGDRSPDFRYGLWRMRLGETGEAVGPAERVAEVPPTVARHPTVAADGRTVAWSAMSTAGELFTLPLSPEGEPAGEARPLTREGARNTWPVFTRDGSRIAFGRSWPGLNPDVWTMDADGSHARQATTNKAADMIEDWFPDGRRVFFVTDRSRRVELYAVDADTGREEALPLADPEIGIPRLSPDGTRIAYQSREGAVTINVWTAELATGKKRQITFDREFIGFPCWSPDGKRLAVQVKRGDDNYVAVVPSDGGDPVQLTFEHGLSWPFSFSPDGDKVAFAGARQDRWAIWWVSRTTRRSRRLTPDVPLNAYVRYPAWSPLGDRVVYERGETSGHLYLVHAAD